MAPGPNLRVRISADLADIKQGLGLLRSELASVKKQAAQVEPATSKWREGLAAVRRQLVGMAAAYASMRTVGSFVRMADDAANLRGRLQLATKSQEEFNKAQRETFRIAQDTSAEWGSIVGLYAQLSQTTGMAQDRILALTKTISQAFTVSGASAQEAANGLRQLQQAMAGGVLRAEEFNTIIETSPRIVQALADHFGISFGQVRKYVNDGKITSEEFARALEKAAAGVDDDFRKMPLTVSKAITQVRNALLKLVGDTDQAEGASRDLAEAIAELARFLESDEAKRGFADLISALVQIARFAAEAGGAMGRMGKETREALAAAEKFLAGNFSTPGAMARASGRDPKDVLGVGAYLKQRFPWLYRQIGAPKPDFSNVVSGSDSAGADSGGGGGEDPTDKPGKALARSNALMRDSVTRALAEMDRLYKGHEVGVREYFAARQELQERAIDLQIEQARNELAVTADLGKRRDLEEQIAMLLRDRAEVAVAAAREQKEAEEDLAKQLGEVKLRLMELDGRTGAVERARLEEEYLDLFKRLEAASDEAGKAMVRNLIDRLVAKAQLDEISERFSQVTGRLSSVEGSISAQMEAGALGMGEGERRLNQEREAALAKLRELRQETMAYLKTLAPDSKEAAAALNFLDQLDTELANIAASRRKFAMMIEDQAADAFGDFLGDLIEGTKSFKEAFADMVRSFAAGVAKMIAQELALRAVRAAMGAFGGGGAGVAHSGGIAGSLATIRSNLSPMLSGAAPRYHSGGIAGMGPDEVPAILRRGEEVLTRNDPRHRFNGGLGGEGDRTVVKQPIVAIGDRAVADALASAAGEEIILTHVRNNWDGLVGGAR